MSRDYDEWGNPVDSHYEYDQFGNPIRIDPAPLQPSHGEGPRSGAPVVDTVKDKAFRDSFGRSSPGKGTQADLPSTLIESARVETDSGQAQSWVVTLGPLTTPGQAAPIATGLASNAGLISQSFIVDSHAVVEWGIEGSVQFALIDWVVGSSFTVFGSYVRVFGVSEAFVPIPGFDVTTQYSAQITPGFTSRQPFRTVIYPGPIAAAGGVVRANVPAYAEAFNVFRLGGVTMVLRFRRGLGDGVTLGGVMYEVIQATGSAMIDRSSEIAIPMGTTVLELENDDPAEDIDQVAVRYRLTL